MQFKQVETLLKKHLPSYKINNATNRSGIELEIIMDICLKAPSIIVYTFRTVKNDVIFKKYNFDICDSIFINGDAHWGFTKFDTDTFEGCIRRIRNHIFGEERNECVML